MRASAIHPDIWIIPALLAVAMLANAAMVPLVPFALATRLEWPLWLIGFYSFAVMVVTMLVNHRLSTIVDTTKRKSLLCLLCASFQIVGSIAAVGALNGALWLLLLTVLGTAIGGAVTPIYYTLGRLLADGHGRSPQTVNSMLRVITSAAWVAGPALGFAVTGTHGITSAFLTVSGISGLGGIAILISSSWMNTAAEKAVERTEPVVAAVVNKDRNTLKLRNAASFAVVFLFSLAHISTATSMALLLGRRFDIAESATGLFLGLKAGVEMVAILLTPIVAKKLSSRAVLTLAGFGALVAYSSYLFGHGAGWALFASVWEGAYYGLFAVTALTWIQSLAGMRLGQSTGFYMNGIYAGVLIGAPVSGFIASVNLSWIAGLSLLAAFGAIAALRLPANEPGVPYSTTIESQT